MNLFSLPVSGIRFPWSDLPVMICVFFLHTNTKTGTVRIIQRFMSDKNNNRLDLLLAMMVFSQNQGPCLSQPGRPDDVFGPLARTYRALFAAMVMFPYFSAMSEKSDEESPQTDQSLLSRD
jgi:hypothetical protein